MVERMLLVSVNTTDHVKSTIRCCLSSKIEVFL
jgi:hypothetical protein